MHVNPLTSGQRFVAKLLIRVRPALLADWLKQIIGVDRLTVTTDHGRFFVDPYSDLGFQLCEHGSYEHNMRATLDEHLVPGSVCVDVGANEGYLTVAAARRCGPEGRVVAIEPQRRLLPVIAENLRLNAVSNVRVLNLAVADVMGEATLHLTPSLNTGASGFHRSSRYRIPTQTVEVRTLTQILDEAELTHIDLMKIDIEGCEYEALLGSRAVFEERRVKVLALELHPSILAARGKDIQDIVAMLDRAGYALTQSHGNDVWIART